MKKFFRFFVCILFSLSLFSQNVYASAMTSYEASLSFSPCFSSRYVLPVINNLGSSTSYPKNLVFNFSNFFDPIFSVPSSSLPNGSYSYNFIVQVDFTVNPNFKHTEFVPANLSFDVSFPYLPEGVVVFLGTRTKDTFDSSFTGSVRFFVSGTNFLRSGVAPSIPLDISVNWVTHSIPSPLTGSGRGGIGVTMSYKTTVTSYSGSISYVSSDNSTSGILGDIDNTIKDQHKEEIDKAEETGSSVTGSSNELTGTLSAWEIFTMPFQLVKDFAQAISSDGNTGFTFPSFSMMGYEIWPSYTFDLNTVKSNFPVLYNGLHLVSGTIVVSGFIHYCWRKWSILMGDDMPDSSASEGGN